MGHPKPIPNHSPLLLCSFVTESKQPLVQEVELKIGLEGNVLGQLELAVSCPGRVSSGIGADGPLSCGLYHLSEALNNIQFLVALSPPEAQNGKRDGDALFISEEGREDGCLQL